jgi:hypothetical protein
MGLTLESVNAQAGTDELTVVPEVAQTNIVSAVEIKVPKHMRAVSNVGSRPKWFAFSNIPRMAMTKEVPDYADQTQGKHIAYVTRIPGPGRRPYATSKIYKAYGTTPEEAVFKAFMESTNASKSLKFRAQANISIVKDIQKMMRTAKFVPGGHSRIGAFAPLEPVAQGAAVCVYFDNDEYEWNNSHQSDDRDDDFSSYQSRNSEITHRREMLGIQKTLPVAHNKKLLQDYEEVPLYFNPETLEESDLYTVVSFTDEKGIYHDIQGEPLLRGVFNDYKQAQSYAAEISNSEEHDPDHTTNNVTVYELPFDNSGKTFEVSDEYRSADTDRHAIFTA